MQREGRIEKTILSLIAGWKRGPVILYESAIWFELHGGKVPMDRSKRNSLHRAMEAFCVKHPKWAVRRGFQWALFKLYE